MLQVAQRVVSEEHFMSHSKDTTPFYQHTVSGDRIPSEAAGAESQVAETLDTLLSTGIKAFEDDFFSRAKEKFLTALNLSTEGDSFQGEIYFYLAELSDNFTEKYDYFKKSLFAYTMQLQNISGTENPDPIIELKFNCLVQLAKTLLHAKETVKIFNLFRKNQEILTKINRINPKSIAVLNFYIINGGAFLVDEKSEAGDKFMQRAKQMLLKGEVDRNTYNRTVITTLGPLLAKLEPKQVELFTASHINLDNSPFDFINIAAELATATEAADREKSTLSERSIKNK